MEGTVSWETFSRCIRDFQAQSDRLDDGWIICGRTDVPNGSYICKRITKALPNLDSYTVEYHIVYDLSYAVPKICFNAYKNDGSLLTLEECQELFNIHEGDNTLTILTQMDHPIFQRPFFTLHPCKTGNMIEHFTSSKNPIVSWLSAVGPVVDLNLSNEYIDLTIA